MRERGVHASLDIAGDGPRRAEYESRARSLGVDEHTRFLGFVDKPALAERMRAL